MKTKEVALQFNETHHLAHVIRQIELNLEGIPTQADQVDLRFLRIISFGDTFDGASNPVNGVAVHSVIYGDRVVFQKSAVYHGGSCEVRTQQGNEMYWPLARASRDYLRIQEIAQAKYLGELSTRNGAAQKSQDTVCCDSGTLKILESHPQFKDLVDSMGVTLKLLTRKHCYQVIVTKSYKTE